MRDEEGTRAREGKGCANGRLWGGRGVGRDWLVAGETGKGKSERVDEGKEGEEEES